MQIEIRSSAKFYHNLVTSQGHFSRFPGRAINPEKLTKMTKFKTQNHLYHSKALEKLYRGLSSEYSRFLNPNSRKFILKTKKKSIFHSFFLFLTSKITKKTRFDVFELKFSRKLKNRLYSLKSPLYSFSRAFEWYQWFWVSNFVIFVNFSGFRALPGKRGKRPCDVTRL